MNKINFISGDVAIINTVNSKTKLYYTGVDRPSFSISKIFEVYPQLNVNSPVWSCKPNKIESFLKSKEKNRIFIIIMENSSEYLSDIKGWMKKNNLKAIFLDEYFTVQ